LVVLRVRPRLRLFFLSNASPPPGLSPPSLHDALPICARVCSATAARCCSTSACKRCTASSSRDVSARTCAMSCEKSEACCCSRRSEEHTSELQSRENLVCRLLLEKKKSHTYRTDRAAW